MYGIDPMKIRIEREKELGRDLSVDEEEDLIKTGIKEVTMPIHNDKPYLSRIVTEDELIRAVEEGWEIVRELNENRFLVRRSNHTAR